MRPSFLQPSLEIVKPAAVPKQVEAKSRKSAASSSEESAGDSDGDKKADMDPKSLRQSLKRYQLEMQAAMNANAVQYLSPEEEARIEKAKLEVKGHYLRFFRHRAVKKNMLFFNRWRSMLESAKHREEDALTIRDFTTKKRGFLQSLRDEKQRLTSGDEDEAWAAEADTLHARTKAEPDQASMMVQEEPARAFRKQKLFKGVFSVYK